MGLTDKMDAAVTQTAVIGDQRLRERIRALAHGFSIEVIPQAARRVDAFAALLPLGTRVFLPALPRTRLEDLVALAARLRREGMEPVPHIAARRLPSRGALETALARLRAEAGITQALVIAGDPAVPGGPFADSMAVLETGLLEAHDIGTIFVGGQPEGIAGVPDTDVDAALEWKNAYARTSSATLRLVTQLTLDIDALIAWQARAATLGNALPVHIGVAGPAGLITLLKFARLTGASAALGAMHRYGARLTELTGTASPAALIARLAAEDAPACAGLHVYTFGGFARAAVWMNALRDGAVAIGGEPAGS